MSCSKLPSVLTTLFNYLISSFNLGSEQCVRREVGGGRQYVHVCEFTRNNSPQNCPFITVSHIFHLMVTGWVSRSRRSERICGARCFSGINPCEGKGKKADLGREEPNCEDGLQRPRQAAESPGRTQPVRVTAES